MEFLSWHYSKGVDYYLRSWITTLKWINHYFSPLLLLKTLFAPWKRLLIADTSPGFNLQKKFEEFTFNIISRGIGAVVRFILFWVGLIFLIFSILGGLFGLLFWLILPFFGLPVYSKYKRQPEIFVSDLLLKLKNSEKDPIHLIFENEAGDFVLSHTGLKISELTESAQKKNLSFTRLKAENFEDVIKKLIKAKVWNEEFFNKRELKSKDLILAASWWDELALKQTLIGKDDLGRPGLALELTYGYTPTLNQYSVDLSLPQPFSHRLIGRQNVVTRMERVLSSGNSVLLMGQPGVGKKTVVLEFAKRAVSGNLGPKMAFKRVMEFDYNALLSKATDLNSKKRELAQALNEAAAAGNVILMVRDIHRLTHPDVEGYDFTDVFEDRLEKRDLSIIAVATNTDYERFISPNLRLRKFLEKVEVTQPSKEEALEILVEAAQRWEKITGLIITTGALRYILEQSDRYITEVPFPEKALELLDAVVTYCQQNAKAKVEIEDANTVLAETTGVSFAKLTKEEKKRLGEIEDIIHERLIDQNAAVNLIGKTLRAKTIGVIKEDRPLGSFLFLGPTGVGKTETAKVLARVYFGSEENTLRFDMAEFSGKEGMQRLIGSVDKNLPGALTSGIKNKPASLLLLDEIEKAPKEIYNLFLSMLDEGFITDAFGKKIICRHLFVIGTSNAGAEFIRKAVERGVRGEELQSSVVNHVLEKEIFSPEFINRFDGVVVYEPLGEKELVKIAHLMFADLANDLKDKNIYLTVTDEAAEKLAKDGFDPAFGARPMKRIVNLSIGDLLGKAIIEGKVGEGSNIKIIPGEGKEEFELEKDS